MAAGSGTTVARLRILFTGDLSEYNAALKKAKSEGDAAAKTLGRTFKQALTGLPKDLLVGIHSMTLKSLSEDAKHLGTALKNAFTTAPHKVFTASLNGVKKTLGTLKSAAGDVFKGMAMGAGIAAFQDLTRVVSDLMHMIPDLISQGKDYGQMVADIVHATGASGEDASTLAASIKFLDPGEVKNLVQLTAQFSKNVLGSSIEAGKLTPVIQLLKKAAGLSVDYAGNILKANGELANQVEALDLIRSAISKNADGISKLRIEAMMQGRGGPKVFLDYFRLTDADMVKLKADWQAQGLIITTEQAKLAEDTNREMRRLGNSITGVGMQIFNALAPELNRIISTIADFITSNLNNIKNFVASAASAVLGFVGELMGVTDQMQAFTAGIGGVAPAISAAAQAGALAQSQLDELDAEWLATGKAAAAAEESAGAATRDTSKAIDDQIAAVQRLDAAQEKVYQREAKRLADIYGAQLLSLDADEKALDAARAKEDLALQLLGAQEDLRRAQTAGPGGTIDLDAQREARAKILAIEAEQREATRVADLAAKRKALEDVKAYIESIATLESASENKKALAKNLATRKAALEAQRVAALAAGDTTGAEQIAARIAAITAAEERTQAAIHNAAKQTALQKQLADIATVTTAVKSATRTQYETTHKNLEQQIADANALVVKEKKALSDRGRAVQHELGPGGVEQGAIESARQAGVKFAKDFKEAIFGAPEDNGHGGLVGAFETLGTTIGNVATTIGTLFAPLVEAWGNVPDELKGILSGAIIGALVSGGNPIAVFAGAIAGGTLQLAGIAQGTEKEKESLLTNAAAWVATNPSLDAYKAAMKAVQDALDDPVTSLAARATLLKLMNLLVTAYEKAYFGGTGGHSATGQYASGGLAGTHGRERATLGERGAEWVINAPALRALASLNRSPAMALAAVAGGGGGYGGQPAVIRLEIGGRPLLDYVDQNLAYRRRP